MWPSIANATLPVHFLIWYSEQFWEEGVLCPFCSFANWGLDDVIPQDSFHSIHLCLMHERRWWWAISHFSGSARWQGRRLCCCPQHSVALSLRCHAGSSREVALGRRTGRPVAFVSVTFKAFQPQGPRMSCSSGAVPRPALSLICGPAPNTQGILDIGKDMHERTTVCVMLK